MTRTRTIVFTLAAAVAAAACSKKDEAGEQGGKATEKGCRHGKKGGGDGKPALKPVSAELFGKAVAPPGDLAKLTINMPIADAVKAAPSLLPEGADDDYQSTDAPGWEGVSFAVGLDKPRTKVTRLNVRMPAAGKDAVIAAWGAGLAAKDSIDRPLTVWLDPATGWRATLEQGSGDDMNLSLYHYIPYAKLLGDAPDTLAFAPEGLIGATVDDLRARHADVLIEKDAATAAKDRKDLEKFTGEQLDGTLGAAKPSVHLELPPTEWESYWTRVHFHWDDAGKVRVVWLSIPYEAHEPAKAEIRAFLEKKWGAPKEVEKYGRKQLVFRDAAPRVVVEDDDITGAWKIEISADE